jgi:acyl-CoA reductase-like NAD-dependent aldehyde dehydrogenase
LNKLPQLKSFLKDGEAESYVGVTVEYIHGRRAVLTIYEDEEEVEKITLSDYATKEEMHALFVEKGFTLKTPEEIEKVKESIRLAEEEKARLRMEQRAQRLLEREARLEMQRKAKENAAMSNDNMEEIKRQARENSDVNRKVEQEVVDMVNKISEEAGVGAEL